MSDDRVLVGGRYELGDMLGRGGMAEVRQAVDTRLARPVAVKRLRADLAADPTFQARFRREAQAAARLNHPSIISIYDTGEEPDPVSGVSIPYIVMELIEGQTLGEVLRAEQAIPPQQALQMTREVLDALSHSHQAGIVHRDVKPSNVMLTPAGGVKVMDFGIARAIADTSTSLTQTAGVIGTAHYLSPEQARGEAVDARSDIYSVGCLLFELLVGRPPFIGDSPVSVAYQHVREPAVRPSSLNSSVAPEIDAIVLRALAKDPADRYQSAADMGADIDRALAGQRPIAAGPPPGRTADQMPATPLGQAAAITSVALGPASAIPTIPIGEASAAAGIPLAEPSAIPTEPLAALPGGTTAPMGSVGQSTVALGRTSAMPTQSPALPPTAAGAPPRTPGPVPPPTSSEPYAPDAQGRPPERRFWPTVLVALLIIALLAGLAYAIYRVLGGKPDAQTVAVPNVVNLTEQQARQKLTATQLKVEVNTVVGAAKTKGRIIAQDPKAGARVATNSTVTITLNRGPVTGGGQTSTSKSSAPRTSAPQTSAPPSSAPPSSKPPTSPPPSSKPPSNTPKPTPTASSASASGAGGSSGSASGAGGSSASASEASGSSTPT